MNFDEDDKIAVIQTMKTVCIIIYRILWLPNKRSNKLKNVI